MALWGNTDAQASAPKIVVRTDGDVATSNTARLGTTQYGNTVFAVSAAELLNTTGASGVANITVTAAGSGFTARPTATITAAEGDTTGTGATATATAKVVTVTIGDVPGTGYANGDVVTAAGGTGTKATFTVTTDEAGVPTALALTTAGVYTALPSLNENVVTGGTGTGLTVDLVMGLNAVTVTNAGSGYTATPTVTIGGAGGTGATATAARISTAGSEAKKVAHAGWVVRKDRGNGRVQYETLVAMGSIQGDGNDDTKLPE